MNVDASTGFQHATAIVEAERLGVRCRVGAFSRLLPGTKIGDDVEIGDLVVVSGGAELGDRVQVASGAKLGGCLWIGVDVHIGSNAVVAAPVPAAAHDGYVGLATRLGARACIGANATIAAGVTVGERAVVRAGAVVTQDVPHDAVVAGNPSRIVGYVDAAEAKPTLAPLPPTAGVSPLRVKGASLIEIPRVVDMRGVTTFAEIDKHLPFVARRYFVVSEVPGEEVRGEHAHKALHEFLVCLKGSLSVMLDDGRVREEIRLDTPTLGLHVPPQVWRVVYKYTPGTLLLSLCSHVYDPDDYIRDYSQFLAFVGAR